MVTLTSSRTNAQIVELASGFQSIQWGICDSETSLSVHTLFSFKDIAF